MNYYIVNGTTAIEVTWEDFQKEWGGPEARHALGNSPRGFEKVIPLPDAVAADLMDDLGITSLPSKNTDYKSLHRDYQLIPSEPDGSALNNNRDY